MDPRIDEQHAALRRTIIGTGAGAEVVNLAGLDVDAHDFGLVVCGEDRELDGTAAGIWRESVFAGQITGSEFTDPSAH